MSQFFVFHPVQLRKRNPTAILNPNTQDINSSTAISEKQQETDTSLEDDPHDSDKKSKYKSCDRCRRYRRKCDRKSPKCSQCETASSTNVTYGESPIPCTYSYRPKKKNPRRRIYKSNSTRLPKIPSVQENSPSEDDAFDSLTNVVKGNSSSSTSNFPGRDLLGELNNPILPDNYNSSPSVDTDSPLCPSPSISLESYSMDFLAHEFPLYPEVMNKRSVISPTSEPFELSTPDMPISSFPTQPLTHSLPCNTSSHLKLDTVSFPGISIATGPENIGLSSINFESIPTDFNEMNSLNQMIIANNAVLFPQKDSSLSYCKFINVFFPKT